MLRLLIFDMDGTLFFTEEANFISYERAFAEEGVTLKREVYAAAFGVRFDALVARVAPQLDAAAAARVKANKARYYRENLSLVKPNAPLLGFLRAMRASHVTALATTAAKPNALAVLEHFGLQDAFDHVLFGESVKKPKPDPECYLRIMEQAGVQPSDCLIFEDSEVGLAAAQASGANVLRVVAS